MGNPVELVWNCPFGSVRFRSVPFGSVRYLRVLFHKHGSEVPSVQGMPERLAMGSDWVTHARPWVARGRPMGGPWWNWNSFGTRRESMGKSFGSSLELVGKSYELLGNLFGIHRELLGNEWGTSREFVRFVWETVGYSWGVPGELVGTFRWEFVLWERSDTIRTHPHACNIPYKTALPVLCTHRFCVYPFLVTFVLPFFSSFLGECSVSC